MPEAARLRTCQILLVYTAEPASRSAEVLSFLSGWSGTLLKASQQQP
ncbi:hypothetical protein ACWD04_07555 [Streptomyces sp. NPDC002911]